MSLTPTLEIRPSNLARRKACPGSARLEALVPRTDDDETEYSREGTLLHKHLANPEIDRSALTENQRELLEQAENLRNAAVQEIMVNAGLPENAVPFAVLKEVSVGFFPTRPWKEAASLEGTPDEVRYYRDEGVLAVLDAKFGFMDVTSADQNWQMACYACMAFDDHDPVREVYVAIFQPRASFGKRITTGMYEAAHLEGVRAEIVRIVEEAKKPDAPLHASPDACRNCRAKQLVNGIPFCEEYRRMVGGLAEVGPTQQVLALPHEQFEQVGAAIKLAMMLKDPWTKEALRRIEADEMPGWSLKGNGMTSTLTDLKEAYTRFLASYGSRYEDATQAALAFMDCLEPKWGKLEALVGKLEKCGDAKARKIINQLFAGLVEKTEKAKSPVRNP